MDNTSNNKQETEETLQTVSLLTLAQAGVFSGNSGLRKTKENNYPFLTFLTKDKKASNLYFTTEFGKIISATFQDGEMLPKELLLKMGVILTKNKEGEERLKLYNNSTSKYQSVNDTFGIVGVSEQDLIEKVRASFSSASDNAVKASNPEVTEQQS